LTLTMAVNPAGETLGGALTATPSQGVATFTGLILETAAAGDILRVTSDGTAAAMTFHLVVMPAAPARLVVIALPSTAGAAGGFSLLATIEDAFGNVVTTYSGSVPLRRATDPHRDARHGGRTAAVNQGIATFSHVKPVNQARGASLQATADGPPTATPIL